MLAQSFKTAAELQVSDRELAALVKVLGMLERGEVLERLFNMAVLGAPDCGTAGCVCGWARTVDAEAFTRSWNSSVQKLFIRPYDVIARGRATTAQAARSPSAAS